MSWQHPVPRITDEERQARLARLRQVLEVEGLAGMLLGPSESLRYFTGLVWHASERFLGALVTPTGLHYIVPGFERSRVETLPHLTADILEWQEEESSAALVVRLLGERGILALDDDMPLYFYHALAAKLGAERLTNGGPLISASGNCERMRPARDMSRVSTAMPAVSAKALTMGSSDCVARNGASSVRV